MGKMRSIQVPEALYERLTNKAAELGFDSAEELALFVLDQAASEDMGGEAERNEHTMSEAERELAETRLDELGYIMRRKRSSK